MKYKTARLVLLLFSLKMYTVVGQADNYRRVLIQQNFLEKAFIAPQLEKEPFKISSPTQVDSIFLTWEKAWARIAGDSMAKYSMSFTPDEFNTLDAYCYFWGLTSLTRNLNASDEFGDKLAVYMLRALRKDLSMVKRLPESVNIGNLDIQNTIAIAGASTRNKETFLSAFALYKECVEFIRPLTNHNDSLVRKAASRHYTALNNQYYYMYSRNCLYENKLDESLLLLITGLNVNRISKSRAIYLTRQHLQQYKSNGDKDKAFTLLNALALNTTTDNLHRDTLANWYAQVDSVTGPKSYADLNGKLSQSDFIVSSASVKLPEQWSFLLNAVPAEKWKTAKYILVDFWYTGCLPCIEEIPTLNQFYQTIKDRPDIIFLSVNTDYENGKRDSSFVTRRSKELKIAYPVFYDNKTYTLNKYLNISSYPSKIILTNNGKLVVKKDGTEITTNTLRELVKTNSK